jgi:hypothetical protein
MSFVISNGHYITIYVVNSNEHYNAISVDIVAILVNSKVIVTVTTLLLVGT